MEYIFLEHDDFEDDDNFLFGTNLKTTTDENEILCKLFEKTKRVATNGLGKRSVSTNVFTTPTPSQQTNFKCIAPTSTRFDLSDLRKSLEINMPPVSRVPTLPHIDQTSILEFPQINIDPLLDPEPLTPAQSPVMDPSVTIEKHAARLIIIRRKKMKKHQLKKLRKKMKFKWAKVRQKREYRKEKEFHAELMGQIKEAEKFDALAYSKEKIDKANEVLIPKMWKGKRLPQFVIEELLEKTKRKKAENLAAIERRKNLKKKVSDYDV